MADSFNKSETTVKLAAVSYWGSVAMATTLLGIHSQSVLVAIAVALLGFAGRMLSVIVCTRARETPK